MDSVVMSRQHIFFTALALSITVLADLSSAQAQDKASNGAQIRVQMRGFPDDLGQAIVSLHNSDETFPKPSKALIRRSVKIVNGKAQILFDNLPPGRYAVAVVHDRNSNNRLDFKWFPYPHIEEHAGVSNNPTSLIGPPSFKQAVFVLGQKDLDIDIVMQK